MAQLQATLVETPEQWELLRVIRNTCRHFMTGAQSEITVEDQANYRAWCNNIGTIRNYLFSVNGLFVGFCRLEYREGPKFDVDEYRVSGGTVLTYGLGSWARGLGFGTELVKMAVERSATEIVYGDQWMNNAAGRAVLAKVGAVFSPGVQGKVSFTIRRKVT